MNELAVKQGNLLAINNSTKKLPVARVSHSVAELKQAAAGCATRSWIA